MAMTPEKAYDFCVKMNNSKRNKHLESVIMADFRCFELYLRNIVGPNYWDICENPLLKNRFESYIRHLEEFDLGRDLDFEAVLTEPKDLYLYTYKVLKSRWIEKEDIIKTDLCQACFYAQKVLKNRWPEIEPLIVNDTNLATYYASYVMNCRWPEAEIAVLNSPYAAAYYAELVIKGRWLEVEDFIRSAPHSAFYYALYVLECRWPEAEDMIKTDLYSWTQYKAEFGI